MILFKLSTGLNKSSVKSRHKTYTCVHTYYRNTYLLWFAAVVIPLLRTYGSKFTVA